ncbi:MAG: CoA transferase [Acidobacteriota bacterium]|nr:CoA transferase [Acidobacteriota bacterium]
MSHQGESFRPLAGVRVLDIATVRAEMAGRLLADLGAEVLKIEPPDGADARFRPPFEAGREGDPESSLYWASVALGKRSIVLDRESPADRDRIGDLAAAADVFIESFNPGTLTAIGLGPAELTARNSQLIYASITPFGQDGPKSHWPATELTVEAAGGRIALQGDLDRPPLPLGFPHSWFHAGAQAAADIAIALNERALSGRGQVLDTSAQEAMIWTLMGPVGYPVATGEDPPGTADDRGDPSALSDLARLFPRLCACADGHVAVAMSPLGQSRGGGVIPQVMRELRAAGRLPPTLEAVDWENWSQEYLSGRMSEPVVIEAVDLTLVELEKRTKEELIEWTLEHKHRLGAIRTTRDLVADSHLERRRFFQEQGGRLHPGLPARIGPAPEALPERAPRLDEHSSAAESWIAARPKRRGRAVTAAGRDGNAFAGLKVADFSWVVAGPTMGKALADHGATVVRVESAKRPDLARRLPPFKDEVEGLNRSQWAGMFNTSKLSLSVDLTTTEGADVGRRLGDWADVVLESFSPGTMARFGLDYETLSAERDDLIMLSTSLFATGGPLTTYVGFGQQAAAMVGLHAITGWPDRPPAGPFGPYTDVIAPKFGTTALAAAILERRRTGKGRYIELSQAETGVRFVEPLVLDETVNGRTAGPRAMDSDLACPHGVYATRGTERYIAVAVETKAQWQGLRSVVALGSFGGANLESLAGRIERRVEIEAALSAWCADQPARDLEAILIDAGVPASVVQRPTDLFSDPHLEHRGFRETHEHSELGPMLYDAFATRFSAKPAMLRGPTPCIGEHTDGILRDILGYTDEEIEALRAADVLT